MCKCTIKSIFFVTYAYKDNRRVLFIVGEDAVGAEGTIATGGGGGGGGGGGSVARLGS